MGYFEAFPSYVIYPRYLTSAEQRVSVFGTTTGSHLGLPDEAELQLAVIWQADVVDGLLTRWAIVEDNEQSRLEAGIPANITVFGRARPTG